MLIINNKRKKKLTKLYCLFLNQIKIMTDNRFEPLRQGPGQCRWVESVRTALSHLDSAESFEQRWVIWTALSHLDSAESHHCVSDCLVFLNSSFLCYYLFKEPGWKKAHFIKKIPRFIEGVCVCVTKHILRFSSPKKLTFLLRFSVPQPTKLCQNFNSTF